MIKFKSIDKNLSLLPKIFILSCGFCLVLPFFFIINSDLFSFSYRQLGYSLIAEELRKKSSSDEEFFINTTAYINRNIYPVGNLEDKSTWNDLIISQAWCDQVSRDVAEILAVEDIPARIIMDAGESHSVGEAYINKKFRFYDAQNNYIFVNKNNELASFEEVAKGEINLENSKILSDIEASKDLFYEYPDIFKTDDDFQLKQYSGTVINPLMGLNRWPNYTEIYGPFKQIIINLIRINSIVNPWFDNLYQDYYLANSDNNLVYKGRNYELFDRNVDALKFYNLSLDDENLKEDGLFYLGRMRVELGDYKNAILDLENLLKDFPDTKWKDPANFFLGEANLYLNNYKSAKYFFMKSRKPYYDSSHKLLNMRI